MKYPFYVLAIPALLVLSACSAPKDANKPVPELARPALIATVSNQSAKVEYAFPGTVRSGERADISFQTGGKLISLPVKEGQKVQQGDILAELDKKQLLNNLQSTEAEFAQAQNNARRFEMLYQESKSISISDLEKVRAKRDILEAKLNNARQQLKHATLTAPFSGTIAKTYVTNFTQVQPGTNILKLHNLDDLEITIDVPGSFISNAPKKQKSVAVFDQIPEQQFPVSYKQFVTTTDNSSESYTVVLHLDNPDGTLILPGMKATVIPADNGAQSADTSSRVQVPLKAIVSDNAGGQFVWRVKQDGTVSKAVISVQSLNGDLVTVSKGLNTGDKVVTAGLSSLREGMKVTPLEQE